MCDVYTAPARTRREITPLNRALYETVVQVDADVVVEVVLHQRVRDLTPSATKTARIQRAHEFVLPGSGVGYHPSEHEVRRRAQAQSRPEVIELQRLLEVE